MGFAHNGQQAIERCKEETFDLILMDVEMPIVDGISATHSIRRNFGGPNAKTPIVFLTAHSMRGDTERFLKAGADSVIAKPLVDLDEFWGRLRVMLPQEDDGQT